MTLEEMVQTMELSAQRLRLEFQQKHPHYMPPEGSGYALWDMWVTANEVLHGVDGARERFPELFVIYDSDMVAWLTAKRLDEAVYKKQQKG